MRIMEGVNNDADLYLLACRYSECNLPKEKDGRLDLGLSKEICPELFNVESSKL